MVRGEAAFRLLFGVFLLLWSCGAGARSSWSFSSEPASDAASKTPGGPAAASGASGGGGGGGVGVSVGGGVFVDGDGLGLGLGLGLGGLVPGQGRKRYIALAGVPDEAKVAPLRALGAELAARGLRVSVTLPEAYSHWVGPEYIKRGGGRLSFLPGGTFPGAEKGTARSKAKTKARAKTKTADSKDGAKGGELPHPLTIKDPKVLWNLRDGNGGGGSGGGSGGGPADGVPEGTSFPPPRPPSQGALNLVRDTVWYYAQYEEIMYNALVAAFEADRPDFVVVDRHAYGAMDACDHLGIPFAINNPTLLLGLDGPPAYVSPPAVSTALWCAAVACWPPAPGPTSLHTTRTPVALPRS